MWTALNSGPARYSAYEGVLGASKSFQMQYISVLVAGVLARSMAEGRPSLMPDSMVNLIWKNSLARFEVALQ